MGLVVGTLVKTAGPYSIILNATWPVAERCTLGFFKRNEIGMIIQVSNDGCKVLTSNGVLGWVQLKSLVEVGDRHEI